MPTQGTGPQRLVGRVTKIYPTFGYINNEIFFQKKSVVGPMVEVDDEVAATAQYQPDMPIKWSASKVWKLEDALESKDKSKSSSRSEKLEVSRPRKTSPVRPPSREHGKSQEKSRSRDRDRSPRVRQRERSRETREREPVAQFDQRKPVKPETLADMKFYEKLVGSELKKAFPSCVPPVDLYNVQMHWQNAFPVNRPLAPSNAINFQVLQSQTTDNETTEEIKPVESVGLDKKYYVNVLLLSMPSLADLHEKSCAQIDEPNRQTNTLTKRIRIVTCGKTGKCFEAIGGAWDRNLDGDHPATNSQTLINTAIRVCKETLDLDLSKCSRWCRFMEFRYSLSEPRSERTTDKLFQRPNTTNSTPAEKDKDGSSLNSESDHDEVRPYHRTVVYFLPDLWTIVPSKKEWSEIRRSFGQEEDKKEEQESPNAVETSETKLPEQKSDTTDNGELSLKDKTNETSDDANMETNATDKTDDQVAKPDNDNSAETADNDKQAPKNNESTEKEEESEKKIYIKKLHSELDVNTMKVSELREQLEVRGFPSAGLKGQLVARLKTQVEKEKAEEEEQRKNEEIVTDKEVDQPKQTEKTTDGTEKPNDVTDSKKLDVKLSEMPSLLIRRRPAPHPSIQSVSLDAIINLRTMVSTDNSYELYVCAKQIYDMFRRDAAYLILKSLFVAADHGITADRPLLKKHRPDNTVNKEATSQQTSENRQKLLSRFVTIDHSLLCAFTLFDTEKNSIKTIDMETILYTLNLPLSRHLVTNILYRVCVESCILYYRCLTDAGTANEAANKPILSMVAEETNFFNRILTGGVASLNGIVKDPSQHRCLILPHENCDEPMEIDTTKTDPEVDSVPHLLEALRQAEMEKNRLDLLARKQELSITLVNERTEDIPRLMDRAKQLTERLQVYYDRCMAETKRSKLAVEYIEDQLNYFTAQAELIQKNSKNLQSMSSSLLEKDKKTPSSGDQESKDQSKPSPKSSSSEKDKPCNKSPKPAEVNGSASNLKQEKAQPMEVDAKQEKGKPLTEVNSR